MDISSIEEAIALMRERREVPDGFILPYINKARLLLSSPSSSSEEAQLLLHCLRLIRDSLAMSPQATTSALLSSSGWTDDRAWLITSVQALSHRIDEQALLALTALSQLLANLASNSHLHENGARSIWTLIFPSLINIFIAHPSRKVAEPGAAALYKLCLADESLSSQLCSPSGRPTWAILLDRSSAVDGEEVNEWLPLLVSCVAVRQGLFSQLMGVLIESRGGARGRWGRYPPVILHLLATELKEMLGTIPVLHSRPFLAALTSLVYEAMLGCREAELLIMSEDEAEGGLNLARHVLEASLSVLRGLLSREDQGLSLFGFDPALFALHAAPPSPEFIELLFCALAALGPPTKPQKNLPQGSPSSLNQPDMPDDACQDKVPSSSILSDLVSLMPHSHPYMGYRGDLLALIANVVVGRPDVASKICSLPLLPAVPSPSAIGSVELLLSQAQLDEKSPVAREWALLAIRNLCLVSEEARARIESLEISGGTDHVIETEEMKKMGMRLERDRETGKMKLKTSRE